MTWNFLWLNNFHDPKFSGTHNILWTQIFVTQYFLEPVIIELQQFGTHNFLRFKNFRDLNFWNQNFSKSSLFLGPCQTPTQLGTCVPEFFYPKIISWTKNLVWSRNIFVSNKFWSKKFCGQNFFGSNKTLNKKIRIKKVFGSTKFWI